MNEEKTVEEVKEKESFLNRVKQKAKDVGTAALGFISDNPMLIIPIISGVTAIFGGAAKAISNVGNGQYDKCLVEDDVTGEEFLVKHPMTNDEILELGSRMIDGEWKGSALDEMGLLRNERKRK